MATKEELIADLSKVISDNWTDIMSEVSTSKNKSNNISLSAQLTAEGTDGFTYNIRASFRKPQTVSQPKTITVNGSAQK